MRRQRARLGSAARRRAPAKTRRERESALNASVATVVHSSYLIPLAAALLASCRSRDATATGRARDRRAHRNCDARSAVFDALARREGHSALARRSDGPRSEHASAGATARSITAVRRTKARSRSSSSPERASTAGNRCGRRTCAPRFRRCADPALGSPHRAVVRAIGSCTTLGDHKLRIRLAEPRATLLSDLEVPILRGDQARIATAAERRARRLGPVSRRSARSRAKSCSSRPTPA